MHVGEHLDDVHRSEDVTVMEGNDARNLGVHATQWSRPASFAPLLNRKVGRLAGLSAFLSLAKQ